MAVWQREKRSYIWMSLLVLVLGSNFLLYRSPITPMVLPAEETKWVILGSLLDLTIVSPLLIVAINREKNFSIKRFIILMAGGLVLARFLIPAKYFEPFAAVSYVGFAIEGLLALLEVTLLFMLVRYLPSIIQRVRVNHESVLFSFPATVEEKVGNHPIVQAVTSELLMFYYAFLTWRKRPPVGEGYFTLHKNSSLIAFQIMMIHAIIVETLGVHWWLHDKSMLVSIVLLIFNVYSVIFFLGDLHAVRLNPLRMTNNCLYLSLGLAKKMELSVDDIDSITINKELLKEKIDQKTTIEFIARDFEAVHPDMILELKRSCQATIFFGFKKSYTRVALRVDNPAPFYHALEERISNTWSRLD